jgi:hypothetical protein
MLIVFIVRSCLIWSKLFSALHSFFFSSDLFVYIIVNIRWSCCLRYAYNTFIYWLLYAAKITYIGQHILKCMVGILVVHLSLVSLETNLIATYKSEVIIATWACMHILLFSCSFPDSMVSTSCCATLDNIVSYIFKILSKRNKQVSQGTPAEEASCLTTLELNPDVLQQVRRHRDDR